MANMTPDQIRTLQRQLVQAGFGVGPTGIDGIMGAGTNKAIRAFQKARGLDVDGVVGDATKAALAKPADVLTGGRPSPRPGVPPTPQTRPGDGQPPVRLGQGLTGPAAGMPRLRPGDNPQPIFAQPPSAAPTPPSAPVPPAAPAPTASVPPGGRFAPPPFDAMRRMDATQGDQAASAAWRNNLPPQMGGIQTGGMGNAGPPRIGIGGSGRPNMGPMADQAGPPRGPSPQPQPDDGQKQAALATLRALLQKQQGQGQPQPGQSPGQPGAPQGPQGQGQPNFLTQMFPPPPAGYKPTPSAPGFGLPGLPPNPSPMGAVGDAGRGGMAMIQQLLQALGGGQTPPAMAQP